MHPLSDWYMENGEYTSVNRSAGMAYDSDNDAWVELGSTPGSTPVWWSRDRKEKDSSTHDWCTHLDANPRYRELKSRLQEAESQRTQIQSKREKAINEQKDNRFYYVLAGFFGVLGLFSLCCLIDHFITPHAPSIRDIVLWILTAFVLFLAISLFHTALNDSRKASTDIEQFDKLIVQLGREIDETKRLINNMESAPGNSSPNPKR